MNILLTASRGLYIKSTVIAIEQSERSNLIQYPAYPLQRGLTSFTEHSRHSKLITHNTAPHPPYSYMDTSMSVLLPQ